MNAIENRGFSTLCISKGYLDRRRERVQFYLKNIEAVSDRLRQELEGQKYQKWWKDSDFILKCDFDMQRLSHLTQNAFSALKEAEFVARQIDSESSIYRIFHKIVGII